MPERHKFTIRNKDVERLKKLQTSARRKQRRLGNLFDVNVNIDYTGITDFKSRKEFNKYVSQLEQFTDRSNYRYIKNKHGLVVPRETYNELRKEVAQLNKENKKRLKKLEKQNFKSRGKDTQEKVKDRKLMGDTRYNEFKPKEFNFDRFRNKKELEEYKESLKKKTHPKFYDSKAKRYKENYITGLENVFGKMAKKLIGKIKKMDTDEFMNLYYTEDIANINFMYEFMDVVAKLSELEMIFNV